MTITDMDDNISLFDINNELTQESIKVVYKGILTQAILSHIAESLKEKIQADEVTRSKVFAIFIELAQNIHHHSDEKVYSAEFSHKVGAGIIFIGESDGSFWISAGNYVNIQQKDHILSRCNFINNLSKDELREFYREERKKPKRLESVGSNVGLIDMARRSENPLFFKIHPIDTSKCFFSLAVKVDKREAVHC